MNTIDTILQELSKIPEPMQLSVLEFIRSISDRNFGADLAENHIKPQIQKHYPLRGMPIEIEPDFDEPMTDMWTALSE